MKYLVLFASILVLHARAIDFVLFEADNCDPDDEQGELCPDYDYNQCCGEFSSSGKLYGAAAVSMGSTAIQNTPTLRGCNEGSQQTVSPCAQIRQSETLGNDPENPGTFPCLSAGAPQSYNGFVVQSIVTSKREEQAVPSSSGLGSHGVGIVVNGTIYGIRHESKAGAMYAQKKDQMTKKERSAFILMHSEVESKVDHWLTG
jgi:hypothetical protein